MTEKNKKNSKKVEVFENRDVFPPRGSSINIPNEVLNNSNEKVLDNIVEDKSKNIGSDLYKQNRG